MRYAIYGIGGFGREVAPVAEAMWLHGDGYIASETSPDIVFVNDGPARSSECNGFPIISFDALASDDHRDRAVIIAVGDGRVREKIENRCLDAGLTIGSLIAPTAKVLACNRIGLGAVLCDNVMVTANATIGRGFQANIYSYIAHDCVISDYVTFAPRVSCNGNVHIEKYAYIGTGAMFVQGKNDRPLVVGEGAIVGMGAVVTKPVEPYTVVTGNPARLLRKIGKPELAS